MAAHEGHHGVAAWMTRVKGWPAYKIALSCRLHTEATSALRLGRADPGQWRCDPAELAAVLGCDVGIGCDVSAASAAPGPGSPPGPPGTGDSTPVDCPACPDTVRLA